MSKKIQIPIQKLISISCRLVSLNLINVFEIRVPNAVIPRIAYIPRKYNISVLSARIINPADHHTILSFIIVNAVVNTINVTGIM